MTAAPLWDVVVALFALMQAWAPGLAFAHLVGQVDCQHAGGVAGGAVDVVQASPLTQQVAGVFLGEVRHAVEVNEVGGGHKAFHLVHALAAPLGVDVEQV
ncbi:hypothetical protein D3C73_697590 [compost metagenome]